MKMYSLKDISWQVSEEEFRNAKAISYSKMSGYLKEGPKILVDRIYSESKSLRFGSASDCLLTEPEVFNDRFVVRDIQTPSDAMIKIIKSIKSTVPEAKTLSEIETDIIISILDECDFGKGWKETTRLSKIREHEEYFRMLCMCEGKQLLSTTEYNSAIEWVKVLKTHPFTKKLISGSHIDEDHFYQLKFTTDIDGIQVKIMLDKVVVDHDAKTIQPIDIKSTSKPETKFGSSLLDWCYYIQAELYTDVLKKVVSNDFTYCNYTVLPFVFVVGNSFYAKPIVWKYDPDMQPRMLMKQKGFPSYKDLLKDIKWHYDNNLFDYPRKVYENNGIMEIDLIQFL